MRINFHTKNIKIQNKGCRGSGPRGVAKPEFSLGGEVVCGEGGGIKYNKSYIFLFIKTRFYKLKEENYHEKPTFEKTFFIVLLSQAS